jgi:hypothetical protein
MSATVLDGPTTPGGPVTVERFPPSGKKSP